MFGWKTTTKLTAEDVIKAVDPKLVRDLAAQAQHPPTAGLIVQDTAVHFGNKYGWFDGTKDKKTVVKDLERLIAMETAKAPIVKNRIGVLAQMHSTGKLTTLLDDPENVADPSKYAAVNGDDDVLRAAKWVAGSSNTLKGDASEVSAIRNLLLAEIASPHPLTVERVDRMWRTLIPQPNPTVRHMIDNSSAVLLCDKLGHVLMGNAITMKLGVKDSIAKALYLMAALIRAHGYPDGNGRIARVVYAVSMLRGLEPLAPAAPAQPVKTAWVQEGHGRYKKVGQAAAAPPPPPSRFVAPTSTVTTQLVGM
jgi:hypothetical protein